MGKQNIDLRDTVSVVLLRHAQSQSNLEKRFTGWDDPPLTEAGLTEARAAGKSLCDAGYKFDVAFSSRLQRAYKTLAIILDNIGQSELPLLRDWRLNERHFGAIQGLEKKQVIADYGEEQVWRWRRGYEACPPALLDGDPAHPAHNPMYVDVEREKLPSVETLADTRARVGVFWREQVIPKIQQGQRIIISTHANALRALMMELTEVNQADMESLEIPTATPIVFQFNHKSRLLQWQYLG